MFLFHMLFTPYLFPSVCLPPLLCVVGRKCQEQHNLPHKYLIPQEADSKQCKTLWVLLRLSNSELILEVFSNYHT